LEYFFFRFWEAFVETPVSLIPSFLFIRRFFCGFLGAALGFFSFLNPVSDLSSSLCSLLKDFVSFSFHVFATLCPVPRCAFHRGHVKAEYSFPAVSFHARRFQENSLVRLGRQFLIFAFRLEIFVSCCEPSRRFLPLSRWCFFSVFLFSFLGCLLKLADVLSLIPLVPVIFLFRCSRKSSLSTLFLAVLTVLCSVFGFLVDLLPPRRDRASFSNCLLSHFLSSFASLLRFTFYKPPPPPPPTILKATKTSNGSPPQLGGG